MRRVLFVGYPVHVHAVREIVNAHSDAWRVVAAGMSLGSRNVALAKLPFVDAVVALGGPGPDALIAAVARRMQIPIAVIWAGSDAATLKSDAAARIRARRYRHAACASAIREELQRLGIVADEIPIVAADVAKPPLSLPERFSVLAYVPQGGDDLYGLNVILEAAERLPFVPFEVVGGAERSRTARPNVTFHRWEKHVTRRLDDATVLLRPTKHDGLSRMVVEALARGRHVIWSQKMQGVSYAASPQECIRQLSMLYGEHERKGLDINHEGLACVRDYFSPSKIARGLERFFDDVARQPTAKKNRAVVSGNSRRVAEFIAAIGPNMPEWDFHPAMSGSKSERLEDALSLIAAKAWYRLGDDDPFLNYVGAVLRKPSVRVRTEDAAVTRTVRAVMLT